MAGITAGRKKAKRTPKEDREASLRRRVAELTPTAEELVRYAREHPTPALFWDEDKPSPPASPGAAGVNGRKNPRSKPSTRRG